MRFSTTVNSARRVSTLMAERVTKGSPLNGIIYGSLSTGENYMRLSPNLRRLEPQLALTSIEGSALCHDPLVGQAVEESARNGFAGKQEKRQETNDTQLIACALVHRSPLLDGTLASGSDDTSVIVWRLPPKSLPRSEPAGAALKICPSAILTGHTSNVRPIHWNSEVPWLLLSGSWDGTVRAWDIRKAGGWLHAGRGASRGGGNAGDQSAEAASRADDASRSGACIACMSDHVADVYGLSTSPSRPFTYASVSRDTTLRVFNLEGVVSSIKTRAVIGKSLHSTLSDTTSSMLPSAPTALCGTASRFLETQLRSLRRSEGTSSIAVFRKIFDFFWGSDGIETFWEVLRWVDAAAVAAPGYNLVFGGGDSAPTRAQGSPAADQRQRRSPGGGGGVPETATEKYGTKRSSRTELSLRQLPTGLMCAEERVVHRDARRASDGALARLLSASPAFIVQDRRLGKSDRLERASRLHLAAGDLRSSCEALIALGRWQTALSLAPGVGIDYWRAVADRYVEVLLGGAAARDCGAGNEGGSGGQVGADVTALSTALLAATGRPMDAIRHVLRGSEEALSLAAAVADGAYPPAAPEETLPEETTSQPAVVAPRAVAEEKDNTRLRAHEGGRRVVDRAAVGGCAEEEGGSDAKLLALIDDHVDEGNGAGGRGGGEAVSTENEEHEEVKASPNHEALREASPAPVTGGGGTFGPKAAEKISPIQSSERKAGSASTPPPGRYTLRPNSHQKLVSATITAAAAAAVQRSDGEEVLRSMTESKAEAFFQASQPVLAAAAMLSICDGSRETAARALAFLVRGEEPELAYAAATALRFPARELTLFVREMSRRAEAWGDPSLSMELLLDAGEEDEISDVSGCEREVGSKTVHGRSTPDGGFWPAGMYGACGGESGPRGAAMVAARATNGSRRGDDDSAAARVKPCPTLSLRSRASYMEGAAAAIHRGKVSEAVRLLVLGGDLEQACDRGVSFLRENLPVLSFPPRPAKTSASAVVQALGSDGGLASTRVSPGLRMQVLAYANYIGANEAMVRGYNPIVAPLFRTASACVQAAERAISARGGERTFQTEADEKHGDRGDATEAEAEAQSRLSDRSRSPSQRRQRAGIRRRGRSSPRLPSPRHARSRSPSSLESERGRRSMSPRPAVPTVFPACMSASVLALAAMRHLASWAEEQGSPRHVLEEGLSFARRFRHEENSLSVKDARAMDDLLFIAEQRAAASGTATETSRQRAKAVLETKSRGESADERGDSSTSSDDTEAKTAAIGGLRRRRSERVSGDRDTGKWTIPLPWRSARGETVVGGSRLPSCRRHERIAWRTVAGGDSGRRPHSKHRPHPLATSSLDFGHEPLPRARGAAFLLEDGETVLGLNEAVMWSKVNPFSPLNTGCRIMPF